MTQIVPAVILGGAVIWAAAIFNRFVTLRNRCRNAWSQVDVQLERRHEVIPELAEIVRRYASHEHEVLLRLSEARSSAVRAGTVSEKGSAEDTLTNALQSLFAVAEAYPGLAAHRTFLQLQRELQETEEKIRFARQFYNDTVMRYNTMLSVFPNILLARLLRFREHGYFSLEDS